MHKAFRAYWIWHDLYRIADEGYLDYVVDNVTARINKYTDSYEKRKIHFNSIYYLIKA